MKFSPFIKKLTWLLLITVTAFFVWVGIDLFVPRPTDLRRFDAREVARLDTAMWRSYYTRERLHLFTQLTELLRTQYQMPFLHSNLVGYYAAKSAFIFKDGKSRADYEKALPDLINFYSAIQRDANIKFDVERVAKLELEWWIVHRERANHQPVDLERALANTAAEIYQMPAESFAEHAKLRAAAMKIRDTKAVEGGVTEADWQQIDEPLRSSWHSLHQTVNQ